MNATLIDGAPAVQLDLADVPDAGAVGQVLVVQNLGPGNVYFDRSSDVDENSGVKIAVNGYWEFASASGLYFAAQGGNADLRFTAVG